MNKYVSVFVVAVLLTICGMAHAMTIRETDGMIFSINVRANATLLQSVVPSGLHLDTYDGSAWFVYSAFRIEKIETHTDWFGWTTVFSSPTWVTKTYIPVYHTGASDRGYLLLTMDFEDSFSGTIQKFGCSGTQDGVQCNRASRFTVETPVSPPDFMSVLMNGENMFFNFTATHVATPSANSPLLTPPQDFVNWLVNRTMKYELGKNGKTTYAQQSGRDLAYNFDGAIALATGMPMAGFSSNLLTTRIPQLYMLEHPDTLMNACNPDAQGRVFCFMSPYLQFIDPSNSPLV